MPTFTISHESLLFRLAALSLAVGLFAGVNACNRQPAAESLRTQGIKGTIYVKQLNGVGYSATDGEIVDITCEYVRINPSAAERLLYTRDAVLRIELTEPEPHSAAYEDWQRIVDHCWNRRKPKIVDWVQSGASLFGAQLSSLNNMRPGFDTFLAILILAFGALYISFRLYQSGMLATRSEALNRQKLSREITKLGYEIDALRQQLGIREIDAEPEKLPRGAPSHLDLTIPQFRPAEFLRHTILRLPDKETANERCNRRRDAWVELRKRNPRALRRSYFARMTINILLTIVAAFLCVSFLLDTVLFSIPGFPEATASSLTASLTFFVFFVLFGAGWLHLNARRRILRNAYREAL